MCVFFFLFEGVTREVWLLGKFTGLNWDSARSQALGLHFRYSCVAHAITFLAKIKGKTS